MSAADKKFVLLCKHGDTCPFLKKSGGCKFVHPNDVRSAAKTALNEAKQRLFSGAVTARKQQIGRCIDKVNQMATKMSVLLHGDVRKIFELRWAAADGVAAHAQAVADGVDVKDTHSHHCKAALAAIRAKMRDQYGEVGARAFVMAFEDDISMLNGLRTVKHPPKSKSPKKDKQQHAQTMSADEAATTFKALFCADVDTTPPGGPAL